MITINTSIAEQATINLYNIDTIRTALTYRDKTDPLNILPIDLTNYRFDFILNQFDNPPIFTYTILSGSLTSTFLTKTGADVNVLTVGPMFMDIRTKIRAGNDYKLIQKVTDSTGDIKVHTEYSIHAKQY